MVRKRTFYKANCELGAAARRTWPLAWRGGRAEVAALDFKSPAQLRLVSNHDAIVFSVSERPRTAQLWQDGRLLLDGRAPDRHVHVVPAGSEVDGWLGPGNPELLTLYLDPSFVTEAAGDRGGGQLLPFFGQGDPLVWQVGEAMRAECKAGAPGGTHYARALAWLLAAHLVRHQADAPRGTPRKGRLSDRQVRRATDFMASHLADDPSLADIAAACGLSPSHFSRSFKAATGLSPHQWMTRRRIEAAKDILRGSALPIADVAEKLGFTTPTDFTRVFRRETGQSPSRFRAALG